MSYWWASQNKNYRTAIPNGTLWTRPRVDGVLPQNRAALDLLVPDDIVFHYGAPTVRAVSRVISSAVDWPRPADYPRGPRESDQHDLGRLVRVDVLKSELALHRDRVAELITWGVPGPFSRLGSPREAYLSPLTDTDADALLAELGLTIPSRTLPGRPHEDWEPGTGTTDAEAIARIRLEQGALRAFLLKGNKTADCAICGKTLPANFLVAGHIIPRSELSHSERHDFDKIAVLICLLGCDALFEYGLIVVDENGLVARGRPTDNPSVELEVDSRSGRRSPGWTEARAASFQSHQLRHTDRAITS